MNDFQPSVRRSQPACPRGVVLLEIMLAVVVLGLLLWPVLLLMKGLLNLEEDISRHARLESWHSLQGRVVAQGLHPAMGITLDEGRSSYFTGLAFEQVSGHSLDVASVVGLQSLGLSESTRLQRGCKGGLVLNGGAALPEVSAPPVLSPDRYLNPPQAMPALGASLPITSFALEGGHLVSPVFLQASESDARVVGDDFSQGRRAYTREVTVSLPLDLLLAGRLGTVWSELDGQAVLGASSVRGADGRLQWLVPVASGFQRVLPSEALAMNYRVDMGSPVLLLGGREYASGQTIDVDYRLIVAWRSPSMSSQVAWSALAREVLARDVVVVGYGFELRFEGASLGSEQGLGSMLDDRELGWWNALSTLQAHPSLAEHVVAASGSWYFRRQALVLPPPERVGDESAIFEAGLVSFQIGAVEGLGRLGRLSARDGLVLSTGPELSLEVLP